MPMADGISFLGFAAPRELGDVVFAMGHDNLLVAQVTREQAIAHFERLRKTPMSCRSGSYNLKTREYRPSTEIPPELCFFYQCLVLPGKR